MKNSSVFLSLLLFASFFLVSKKRRESCGTVRPPTAHGHTHSGTNIVVIIVVGPCDFANVKEDVG